MNAAACLATGHCFSHFIAKHQPTVNGYRRTRCYGYDDSSAVESVVSLQRRFISFFVQTIFHRGLPRIIKIVDLRDKLAAALHIK